MSESRSNSLPTDTPAVTPTGSGWTFLTNHSHVLICLARDPLMRLREIAVLVGVTERAVQRIIAELEEAGVITRLRKGRRNHYEIHPELPLRHSVEAHCTVGDLMRMLAVGEPASAIVSTADRD